MNLRKYFNFSVYIKICTYYDNFFIEPGISKTNSIIINGGDASETDESGIDIGGSDISNLANMENDNSTTPFNNRKIPQVNNTLDIDIARSMQVSSV